MPKPLSLRAADAAIRALLRPRELELREDPHPSAFLNGEPVARFFGPSWDDVVRQACLEHDREIEILTQNNKS